MWSYTSILASSTSPAAVWSATNSLQSAALSSSSSSSVSASSSRPPETSGSSSASSSSGKELRSPSWRNSQKHNGNREEYRRHRQHQSSNFTPNSKNSHIQQSVPASTHGNVSASPPLPSNSQSWPRDFVANPSRQSYLQLLMPNAPSQHTVQTSLPSLPKIHISPSGARLAPLTTYPSSSASTTSSSPASPSPFERHISDDKFSSDSTHWDANLRSLYVDSFDFNSSAVSAPFTDTVLDDVLQHYSPQLIASFGWIPSVDDDNVKERTENNDARNSLELDVNAVSRHLIAPGHIAIYQPPVTPLYLSPRISSPILRSIKPPLLALVMAARLHGLSLLNSPSSTLAGVTTSNRACPIHFVGFRANLRRVLSYSQRIRIDIQRVGSTLYFRRHRHYEMEDQNSIGALFEEACKRAGKYMQASKLQGGKTFGQDKKNVRSSSDNEKDAQENKLRAVVKANLGQYFMLTSMEVDLAYGDEQHSRQSSKAVPSTAPSQSASTSATSCLSAFSSSTTASFESTAWSMQNAFIELKSAKRSAFTNIKRRAIWLQCFLAGIQNVVVGWKVPQNDIATNQALYKGHQTLSPSPRAESSAAGTFTVSTSPVSDGVKSVRGENDNDCSTADEMQSEMTQTSSYVPSSQQLSKKQRKRLAKEIKRKARETAEESANSKQEGKDCDNSKSSEQKQLDSENDHDTDNELANNSKKRRKTANALGQAKQLNGFNAEKESVSVNATQPSSPPFTGGVSSMHSTAMFNSQSQSNSSPSKSSSSSSSSTSSVAIASNNDDNLHANRDAIGSSIESIASVDSFDRDSVCTLPSQRLELRRLLGLLHFLYSRITDGSVYKFVRDPQWKLYRIESSAQLNPVMTEQVLQMVDQWAEKVLSS